MASSEDVCVMLSYNWNSQALVSKVHHILVENGLKVWMDIHGGMRDNVNVRYILLLEMLERIVFVLLVWLKV